MEAGEKEMRKAFEEVTTRNVQAAINYSTETRKIVRELEKKVLHFEKVIVGKDKIINDLIVDAKIPLRALATRLKVSFVTVMNRIKKLEAKKIIKSYRYPVLTKNHLLLLFDYLQLIFIYLPDRFKYLRREEL
jgi:hypothetical protein